MVEEFVSSSLFLLSLERAEEVAQSEGIVKTALHSSGPHSLAGRERSAGAVLRRLAVSSQRVGLYGRTVVALEAAAKTKGRCAKRSLPSNSLTNGDIVGLFSDGRPLTEKLLSGIVVRCTTMSVSVAFDEFPDAVDLTRHGGSLQIIKLANDVTYRRMKSALEQLLVVSHGGRTLHLISCLHGNAPLSPTHLKYTSLLEGDLDTFPFHTAGLDSSQRRAVVFALARPDVAVIHGPPGTGKTTTVVEVVLQAVDQGQKVLACAPSNIAVDNMVEKLGKANAKILRVGHPARLDSSILPYSLDAVLSSSDSAAIIRDVRRDIEKAYAQLVKVGASAERRKWRSEVKALKRELRQREEKCLKELLTRADVVLTTLTGASSDGVLRYLPGDHFGTVVIDECAQALEASCWIALLRAPKCVLAGDHLQLPPTILSREAAQKGLSVTLMERLVREHRDAITATLSTQYRMHRAIMSWPAQALYESRLTAHDSVSNHLLSDLRGVEGSRESCVPLVLVDTVGCGLEELDTSEEESKGNEGEADLVVHHIKKLVVAGVSPVDIAVIAPYNLQVDLIRQRLHAFPPPSSSSSSSSSSSVSEVEVHTVDGFQGREKEAVIISLTRSNTAGEIGFLREQRRTNVAVTRARRHLCVVGDSATVSHEPFIRGLIEHCHSVGEVRSAHEYLHEADFEESHHYKPSKTRDGGKGGEGEREKIKAAKSPGGSEKKHTRQSLQTKSGGPPHNKDAEKFEPLSFSKRACKKSSSAASFERNEGYEEIRSSLQKQISSFVSSSDDRDVLSFPSTLTAAERRIVHEICEERGLVHESRGEGSERFVQVEKNMRSFPRPLLVSLEEPHHKETDSQGRKCLSCGRDIPILNWELHLTQCEKQHRYQQQVEKASSRQRDRGEGERKGKMEGLEKKFEATEEKEEGTDCRVGESVESVSREQDSEDNGVDSVKHIPKNAYSSDLSSSGSKIATSSRVKSRKSKQNLPGSKKPSHQQSSTDDLDTLLAEFTLADNTCSFPPCEKRVNLVGLSCQFCRRRHCMAHSLPEVHGCAEAAKKHSRGQLKQEMRKGAGVSGTRRALLHRQLDKKIGEKTNARNSANKNDKS